MLKMSFCHLRIFMLSLYILLIINVICGQTVFHIVNSAEDESLLDHITKSNVKDTSKIVSLLQVKKPVDNAVVEDIMRMKSVLRRLQKETGADHLIKLNSVISAERQMVSGELLHLRLKVDETNCFVGNGDANPTNCVSDPTEDPYICEIAIWNRPWLNSTKILDEKTRCAEMESDADFKLRDFPLTLASSSVNETVLDAMPDGMDEQQIAAEAFTFIDKTSDSRFMGFPVSHTIKTVMFDPVTNATKFLVELEYGFTVCLRSGAEIQSGKSCPPDGERPHYVCSLYVVSMPNDIIKYKVIPLTKENGLELLCHKKPEVEESLVVAVDGPCLGCPEPVALNDPVIEGIAEFALNEYDKGSDDESLHAIARISRAHRQAVNGVKYYLTLDLVETHCKKSRTGAEINRILCDRKPGGDVEVCEVEVLEQSFLSHRELIDAKCYDRDLYPPHLDDELIVPVSRLTLAASQGSQQSSEPLSVVDFLVAEYNRLNGDGFYSKLLKVHSTEQVSDSPPIYNVVVELGETICSRLLSTRDEADNCSLDTSEEHEVCSAVVVSGERMTLKGLTCIDLDDYLKMTSNSAETPKFLLEKFPFLNLSSAAPEVTNSSLVWDLGTHAVEQYNILSEEDQYYVLTRILRAATQNASDGSEHHFLELQAAETTCKKYHQVLNASLCSLDIDEEPLICQVELTADPEKAVKRLYCDEVDDYYERTLRKSHLGAGSPGGVQVDVNDETIKRLAEMVADEFDLRSDQDNLFVLVKILSANQWVERGLNYHLKVELAETVCPKYKRRILKSRCAVDIGEEHEVCEAVLRGDPLKNTHVISDLRCSEMEGPDGAEDSDEVQYPRVHPSAHMRPRFLTQLTRDDSAESRESNEKYYRHSSQTDTEISSEELLLSRSSNESDDSHGRRKRALVGGPTPLDVSSSTALEMASFAMDKVNSDSSDPRLQVMEEIVSATSQVVSGRLIKLVMLVRYTECLKKTHQGEVDVASCHIIDAEPPQRCSIAVWDQPWLNRRKVTELTCNPMAS